jgi:hypothetical protein
VEFGDGHGLADWRVFGGEDENFIFCKLEIKLMLLIFRSATFGSGIVVLSGSGVGFFRVAAPLFAAVLVLRSSLLNGRLRMTSGLS